MDDPYTVLDEALTFLEEVEEEVGRLASKARAGERLEPGDVYRLYTLLVRVSDALRKLRTVLYDKCK